MIKPTALVISKDYVFQKLIADVPFFTTGILALAITLFLLVKQRISLMTGMIMLSSFFSFTAALVDLVILVELSNSSATPTPSNPSSLGSVTPRIVREMLLSCAITLRFLFFWHVVGLPSRLESPNTPVTLYPAHRSFVPTDRDMHSGSWTQWGIFGVVLKYILLIAVVAVGVLESIWRLEFQFVFLETASTIQSASATLETALSAVFALKLLGNLMFMKQRMSKGRAFMHQMPVLVGMALSAGVGAGDLIIETFMDYPLGRLLQAFEIYILCQYVLLVAFDDVPSRSASASQAIQDDDEKRRHARRVSAAESFSAVQMPSDDAISPNPALILSSTSGPDLLPLSLPSQVQRRESNRASRYLARPPMTTRSSSAERIASWVSRRISGRPADYTAPTTTTVNGMPRGRGRSPSTTAILRNNRDKNGNSISETKTMTESVYSTYSTDDIEGLAGAVNGPIRALSSQPQNLALGRSGSRGMSTMVPPVPKLNLGQYDARAPGSPIYGLDGPMRPNPIVPALPASTSAPAPGPTSNSTTSKAPIRTSASSTRSSLPSNPAPPSRAESPRTALVKAIEQITEESLQLPEPNLNASKSMQFSDVSSPRSGGSPFSLGRFPLPPPMPSSSSKNAEGSSEEEGSSMEASVDADADAQTIKTMRDSTGAPSEIELAFEFVPPRRRFEAAQAGRQQSFPSTMRSSGNTIEGVESPGSTPLNVPGFRFEGREITSFIGGASGARGSSGAERELAEARAISRILSPPATSASTTLAPRMPPPVLDMSLPSNPRPVRSPENSPTAGMKGRISVPSRPPQPEMSGQTFERPRPAPAPIN